MRLQPLQPPPPTQPRAIKPTAMAKLQKTDIPVTSLETVNATGTAAATASAETEIAAGIDIVAAAARQIQRGLPAATQAVTGAVGVGAGAETGRTATRAAIEMEITIALVGMPADAHGRARALLEDVSTALVTERTAAIIAIVATREMMIVIVVAAGLLAQIEALETLHLLSLPRTREIVGQYSYNSLQLDSGQKSSRSFLKRLAQSPKLKLSRTVLAIDPKGMCIAFVPRPDESC